VRVAATALALLLALVSGAQPTAAVVAGGSAFDGHSWEGAAGFAKGGSSEATTNAALDCEDVYRTLTVYLAPTSSGEPPRDPVNAPGLTESEINDLLSWPGWGHSQLTTVRCLDVNRGWLTASGAIVQVAQSDGVAVNVVDGNTDCDPGELLFSTAHYYWDNYSGSWAFGYGTNDAKVINEVTLLEITGSITFVCAPIFDPDVDVADFASTAPSVQVNHNPLVVGLTGLDTWFWYDFTQPGAYSQLFDDSVSVTAYGKTFVLDAEIWMDGIDWDIDCEADCGYRGARVDWDPSGFDHELTIDFPDTETAPAPVYDGGDDTEDAAAGTWLYEEKGTYTLSTATHWRGLWTFNGLTYSYPPVVISDEVDYLVEEIRGVLTTPEP
jgi:hypothetical protein